MSYLRLLTNTYLRIALVAFLFCLVALAGSVLYVFRYLDSPIATLTEPTIFEVTAGSSFARVARDLNTAGYVRHPRIFELLGRWRGVAGAIKTGEYRLQSGLSPEQLLDVLVQGNTVQYRVTLVEGWTFEQALAAIWGSEKIQRQLPVFDPEQVAQLLGLSVDNPEGMLFPDTYFYTSGTTDIDLLRRANGRLQSVLAAEWENRLGALPFDTPYEALILASIIEKESAFGAERGHIAGVFVRRLELGMRLQSDPTVIYGLGPRFDGNLTRANLSEENGYNTYRIAALPPTPIALSGRESIHASLHPLPSSYLYFVSKGNGEHHFSTTLEEHNAAVRQYQLSLPTTNTTM